MNRGATSILLSRARNGTDGAVNEVLEQVGDRLLAFIRLRLDGSLRPHVDSGDILQATLLRAFQNFEQFEGSASDTLMGWMTTIARNEINRAAIYHGRQKRDVGNEVPLDDAVPHEIANQVRSEVSRISLRREVALLEEALDMLEPQHREVILLRKFEELSYPQIAQQMGRSSEACRKLLARAMTELSEAMIDLTKGSPGEVPSR